jgi:hypothetical protein
MSIFFQKMLRKHPDSGKFIEEDRTDFERLRNMILNLINRKKAAFKF